jgi:prepilin-type N-terminal cleavage/methylation domain-containing protein
MSDIRCKNGLTLIELLVAMLVTSIVMTAVATLAFAVGSANKTTDDTSVKQAQIRFATMRISELIRHSKLICYATNEELLIWRADDTLDTDGRENTINVGELVYIETGANAIRLLEFTDVPVWLQTTPFTLAQLSGLKAWFMSYCTERYSVLVPECSNVQFGFIPALPPRSKFATVSFDVAENGVEHPYQINAALLGWAGNLLDDSDEIVEFGDDD